MKGGHIMANTKLQQIIKSTAGPMTDAELRMVCDMVTSDIKANRLRFGLKTTLRHVAESAAICLQIVRRCDNEKW
jgi:hypothetical protein